ncbi:MAG: ribonuclease HI family protein [bacterium]
MKKATLHSDGGARGNPGPAGIGYVLRVEDSEAVFHGEYIGETTNNQAEYTALIMGLKRAWADGISNLKCFLDSELVVKQLQGSYKVKNEGLKPLFVQVQELAGKFAEISYSHVSRDKNKEADKLVNGAIDKHT